MRKLAKLAIAIAFPVVTCLVGGTALAGTKYQTSLVPSVTGSMPGFAASGSSIKIDDKLSLKGKIKKVVDDVGEKVTTDPALPGDDYTVEVDLSVAQTAASGTVVVSFDVKKGNGKFAAVLSGDPVLSGAGSGAGVSVNAVRVKDSAGMLLGGGGFALK